MNELFVKLTLAQRYALVAILPEKGDFVLIDRVRKLRDALVPTEKEERDFGIKQPDGTMRWDLVFFTKTEQEFAIGETMADRIHATLTKLDSSGELTQATGPLYKKFVKPENVQPVDDEKPEDKGASPGP